MIYHITTGTAWQQAKREGRYSAESLKTDGFIHCSAKHQVEPVANSFYKDIDDLVLLCIDENRLTNELRWEDPAHPTIDSGTVSNVDQFPHVYGDINLDAVAEVVALVRLENGDYVLAPDTP